MECVCSLSSMHWEVTLITLTILWRRQQLANTCLDLNICNALAFRHFRVLCECIESLETNTHVCKYIGSLLCLNLEYVFSAWIVRRSVTFNSLSFSNSGSVYALNLLNVIILITFFVG